MKDLPTFRDLHKDDEFRFEPRASVYRKIGHDRYQLVARDGRPVPGLTYQTINLDREVYRGRGIVGRKTTAEDYE